MQSTDMFGRSAAILSGQQTFERDPAQRRLDLAVDVPDHVRYSHDNPYLDGEVGVVLSRRPVTCLLRVLPPFSAIPVCLLTGPPSCRDHRRVSVEVFDNTTGMTIAREHGIHTEVHLPSGLRAHPGKGNGQTPRGGP